LVIDDQISRGLVMLGPQLAWLFDFRGQVP
jgi:hypothetical protein